MPFTDIAAIEAANNEAGKYFFSPDALRFFDSAIHSEVYNGRYFITSEQFHGSDGYSEPRKYTIRRAEDDGNINTIGEFNSYGTTERSSRNCQNTAC